MYFEVATIEEETAERFVLRFRINDDLVKSCTCLMVPLVVILSLLSYMWYYSIIFGSFLVLGLVIRVVFWTRVTIDSPGKTIQVDSNFPVTNSLRTHAIINFDELSEVLVHNYGQDKAIWLRPRESAVICVTRGVSVDQAAIILEQIKRRTGARVVEERVIIKVHRSI